MTEEQIFANSNSTRFSPKLVALALLLVVLTGEILWLARITDPPHRSFFVGHASSFIGACLAPAAILYFIQARRSWRDGLYVLAGMVVSSIPFFHYYTRIHYWIAFSCLGMGTILAATVQGLIRRENAVWRDVLLLAAIPAFYSVAIPFLRVTSIVRHDAFDTVAFLADRVWGVQPSFYLATIADKIPSFRRLMELVYTVLGFALVSSIILHRRRNWDPWVPLVAFLLAGALGYTIYLLCPVIGPVYVFREVFPTGYPRAPAASFARAFLYEDVEAPRNCMPSLHTAWALLAFLHGRRHGLIATLLFGGFFVLTMLATMALGLHYAIDLVVALPFVLFLQAWVLYPFAKSRRRLLIWGIVSASVVAVWLSAISLFPAVFATGIWPIRIAIASTLVLSVVGLVLVEGNVIGSSMSQHELAPMPI